MHSNVQDVLDKQGIEYTEKGEDFLVQCINPAHEDSSPSLRIHRVTGDCHCFSCGFKQNIFKHYGEYQSKVYDLVYEVESEINELLVGTRGLDLPESIVPFEKEFRGIKPESFKRFEAFTHTDPEFLNRVVFPIKDISGVIRGFIGRYTHSKASPKYRVHPPFVKLPIYPIPSNSSSIMFVEGLFDMINLYDKGVDFASCLFGTHNLTYKNVEEKLAPIMASGIVRVFLLLDKDRAGTDSAIKLKKMIESKTDLRVYDLGDFLDDGQDPGDLKQDEVDWLLKYMKNTIAKEG